MSTDDAKLSYSVGNFTVLPTTPTSEIKAYCNAPAGQRAFDNDKLSCIYFFQGLFDKWNIHRSIKLIQGAELAKLYRKPQSSIWPSSLTKFWPLFLVLGIITIALLSWIFLRPRKMTEKVIKETIITDSKKPEKKEEVKSKSETLNFSTPSCSQETRRSRRQGVQCAEY